MPMDKKFEKSTGFPRSWVYAAALSAGLVSWAAWRNTRLEVTRSVFSSPCIPAGFSGCRIVQVSDLHNKTFGRGNDLLLEAIKQAAPDCIFITGDFVDSRNTDLGISLDFAQKAATIAPAYYVPGNHEARLGEQYLQLTQGLKRAGVTVLQNQKTTLTRGGDTIHLIGIEDPGFQSGEKESTVSAALSRLTVPERAYTILLIHRPELFPLYAKFPIDLVFSGHAHGGQIRIPYLGGVYVPSQGLFPEYDAGRFTRGKTTMFLSRGLSNGLFPPRIHNRPELLVVELRRE